MCNKVVGIPEQCLYPEDTLNLTVATSGPHSSGNNEVAAGALASAQLKDEEDWTNLFYVSARYCFLSFEPFRQPHWHQGDPPHPCFTNWKSSP
jgi:hypothetical protein